VTRLDRLARSTRDLLNFLDAIGKAGAGFKSLSDARPPNDDGLAGLAELERESAGRRGAKFQRQSSDDQQVGCTEPFRGKRG
jgi:DNA invertase Pin-like site-specific DNA recombinase